MQLVYEKLGGHITELHINGFSKAVLEEYYDLKNYDSSYALCHSYKIIELLELFGWHKINKWK